MFTRRSFLSSLVASTVSVPAAMATPTLKGDKWNEDYDIVIVGGGAGGFSAAVEAAKLGLSAVVIEKQAFYGGSSVLCGGAFTFVGTEDQKERGIKDSDELFFDDMRKVGGYKNDPELIKAYMKYDKDIYDYITKDRGIKPHSVIAVSGMSAARSHGFNPGEVVKAMHDDAVARGVKVLLNTRVERLVWDAEKQRIVGVQCDQKGKQLYIEAKKGVLLAAGGFARNKAMLEKYNPLMANIRAEGGMANVGDGILMAQAYGADVIDTNYIKGTHGYRPTDPNFNLTCHSYYFGGILVDKNGKRFVNESLSYKLLGDASLKLDNGISYAVFDEDIRKSMKDDARDWKYLEGLGDGKDRPWCFQGKTIEEVAKKAGVSPEGLKETIDRYNANVEKLKKDPDFGREHLTTGFGDLKQIKTAPFFVYPVEPRIIATYCGLRINPQAQVLDIYGKPIPGLYACGEMTGGVHGAAYMTGTSIVKSMIFGKIAAMEIAGKKS